MAGDHAAVVAEQDALRWYTPALRIPKFLGKLPSGERLPGGPYTAAQGATFAVVVVVVGLTMRWWRGLLPEGPVWGLGAYVIVLGAGIVAGIAARFTPRTSMNPVDIASGIVQQICRGALPGRRSRPGAIRGSVTITTSTARPPRQGASDTVVEFAEAAEIVAPSPLSSGGSNASGPVRPQGGTAAKLAALVSAASGPGGGA